MKSFKILFFLVIAILIVTMSAFVYYSQPGSYLNPASNENKFFVNLNYAIQKNRISLASPIISKKNTQQVEFIVDQNQNSPTKVIFSTQKDPILQTTTLQQIFKIATINDKYVYLVDLSLNHPYVTLKNN